MKLTKHNIATFIAILFHLCGAVGILASPYRDWFIKHTPLNLILLVLLLIWNQPQKNKAFFAFLFFSFLVGMGVEMIGVNTGNLFGAYRYGTIMGNKLNGVPWLIGLNWFVLMFCCGIVMTKVQDWLKLKYETEDITLTPTIEKLSLIFDGATLATFFDWIMEPVATKLGFWVWKDGVAPYFNYVCWFVVSMLLMWFFSKLRFSRANHFALDLLIIQTLFFLALRFYL
jgi:putative membrane protein